MNGDDNDDDNGHRVLKLGLLSSLSLDENQSALVTTTIRRFMESHSEIALYGSIDITAFVAKCIQHPHVGVPAYFLDHGFLDQAFYSNFRDTPTRLTRSNILQDVVEEIGNGLDHTSNDNGIHSPDFFNVQGYAQMRNYCARMYKGNIVTMVKAGWMPNIKDHMNAYLMIDHANDSKHMQRRLFKESMRRIVRPASNPANNAPVIDQHALDLIQFQRNGYNVNGDDPINEYTFDDPRNYHHSTQEAS